ncbi:hypothetical protein [Reyranella sp.]|uniref:hypothetical protein n=1 Tax=Reyranella sp. TaxID=1929291 RepID=UPI003C7EA50E
MGGSGDSIAARNAELTRQNDTQDGIRNINSIFDNQFTDDYFKGRSKAFLDYATPQLDDQFADARKKLTFHLDRNGLLNSTSRTGKEAELAKLYDTNKRAVADKGLDFENSARNAVADARTGLVNQVVATGDENAAATNAQSRASLLTQPDTYEPLGQLFSTFTSALGTQAGLEKANAYAGTGVGQSQIGNYNTGLFGPRYNAVQVTP